jgi:hypothetical protein
MLYISALEFVNLINLFWFRQKKIISVKVWIFYVVFGPLGKYQSKSEMNQSTFYYEF